MKEPTRLKSGGGPASDLMRGSGLRVPDGARKRALQFTGVAVGMTASGTAAAALSTASLVKSLVITISLGALGGGLASLGVSRAIARFDQPAAAVSAARPRVLPTPSSGVRHSANPDRPALVAPSAPGVVAPTTSEATNSVAPTAAPVTTTEAPALPSKGRVPAMAPVSPPAPMSAPSRPSLFEEQRSIESARAAVARGDATTALKLLDQYERDYSPKQFGPEALALRVQAQSAAGRASVARALAHEFEQKYPHHPLLPRVQGAAGHE